MNRYFRIAGVLFIGIGVAMVAGKLLAFDAIEAFVVRALSQDQVITVAGEALLSRFWYTAASVALLIGGFLCACSIDAVRGALEQWIGRDAMTESNPEMPRPVPVLLWSSLCGLIVVILYLMHSHLGIKIPLLFKKEGLFENLTFVLYLLSAVACAIAAQRIRRNPSVDHRHWVVVFYVVCAVAFFLVAGEEVSWGQRVLGIKTPDALVVLNYQHETNVHNLLTKRALDVMTKWVALVFLLGLIAMWALNSVLRMQALYLVIPSPSLAGLALIASYSGLMLHLEIFEVLLAMFITFYSYRVYIASVHRYDRYTVHNLAYNERKRNSI